MPNKSRYLHFYYDQVKEISLAYHALSQEKVVLNKEIAVILDKAPIHEVVDEEFCHPLLLEKGMLITSPDEDEKYRKVRINELGAGNADPSILYIFPSMSCNLSCAYCSVEDGGKKPGTRVTNPDLATNAIKWFSNYRAGKPGIPKLILYGGEPTLSTKTISASLQAWNDHVRSENSSARVSLITNGTLLDDNLIQLLKIYRPSISISMDGPKLLHDKQRPFSRGGGSYDKAYKSFRRLQDEDLKPSISCTLYKSNLARFDEMMDWICEDVKPLSLGFNVVHCRTNLDLGPSYYEECAEFIMKAFSTLRQHGIYEDRAMRRVHAFASSTFHLIDCAGLGRQVALDADGQLGICHVATENGETPLGSFTDIKNSSNNLSSREELKEWAEYTPILDDGCQNCPAIAICGGGCKYNVHLNSTKRNWKNRDLDFCKSNVKWMEWLASDLLSNLE
ncbi:MAG: radical SAM protein [Candidatus Thiodiazotropha sp.]